MRRSGNTVLITGGASGIGLALAERLLAAGNTVIVCGRDPARLDAACARLPGLVAIRADVADPAAREALAREVTGRFPALNVLINNAGHVEVCDPAAPAHVDVLRHEIAVNLLAPVALTMLLLPRLRLRDDACIVNVTTGYVFLPSARTAPYSATKAAMHVMTRALRFQLRGTTVRVVEVMPPAVDTAMATHYPGPKLTVADAADRILRGLLRDRQEIVIGLSRLGRLTARIAPNLAFGVMNRLELRPAPALRWPGRRRPAPDQPASDRARS